MWLLLFNCDSKLGVAKPEIPVLALREPESDILTAWQLISSLFSEIFLENNFAAELMWPRKQLGLYATFWLHGAKVMWNTALSIVFFFFLQQQML